ncbi:hypothetical protein E7X58_20245 [Streptomyces sp. A1499]|nr:hypothetical protein E7X58_20245 [Streptomyces sp. A1499]
MRPPAGDVPRRQEESISEAGPADDGAVPAADEAPGNVAVVARSLRKVRPAPSEEGPSGGGTPVPARPPRRAPSVPA